MAQPCPWPEMAGGGKLLCPCCAQPLTEGHRRTEPLTPGECAAGMIYLERLGWTPLGLLEHASEALNLTSPGMTDWLRVHIDRKML
jgi:hypothetical protein